ncbi:MAG: hypothetical protein G8237_07260 [Magnetococcales bacterium]|nr:hypothetical protein [Magnetococcales bacterium]
MNKRPIWIALLLGWAWGHPGDLAAFGVGEVTILTTTPKKFRAEIPVRLSEGETLKQVQIGSATDYLAMGVTRTRAHDGLTARLVEKDGETRILISSNSPEAAKGFDLILRVTSSKHTNFPVFKIPALAKTEPATEQKVIKQVAENVTLPAAITTASPDDKAAADANANLKSAQKLATATPTTKPSGAITPGMRQYGPVRAGDTLTSIARGLLVKGMTLHQLMAAIYERNPEHFLSGNMNNLISGGTLKIPATEEIKAIPDRQARVLCMAHFKAWEQMQAGQNVPLPPQNVLLAAEEAAKHPQTATTETPPTKPPVEEQPALQSQLQSAAPPGASNLENVLVRLQSQLGELTEVIKNGQTQQVKLESRVSALELAKADNEALAKRVAHLEQVVNQTTTLRTADGSAPIPIESRTIAFSWFGVLFAGLGALFAGWLVWTGRRWNRQAQQDGLRKLLTVTAKEYPEVAKEILREMDPGPTPFIPSILAGKLDGVPPPAGKKLVHGNVLHSVQRLNALEADRGESK